VKSELLEPSVREAFPQGLDQSVQALAKELREEFNTDGSKPTRSLALWSKSQVRLSKVAAEIFVSLCKYWERPAPQASTPQTKDSTPQPQGLAAQTRKNVIQAFRLCENFVASQVVAYLNSIFLYLRYCLICAGSALLFLLMATSSYPFSKQNQMMNFAWALLLLFSCVYLYVFMQFDRSEVIRAIKAQKGEKSGFNRAAFSQVILFGLLPVLVFLGSKFPSLGRLIFAWAGPLVKALNLSR